MANNTIKQRQMRSGCRHSNWRTVLQHREYECPEAFGNNSDKRKVPTNEKCPKCQGRMRRSKSPLVCRRCGNRFHIKCANRTRDALQMERRAGTWECEYCQQEEEHGPAAGGEESVPIKTGRIMSELKILQWNCDGLMTKKDELKELLHREGVQVALLEETKLGQRDDTPRLRGYSAIRMDRSGSRTTGPRAGVLCTYVQEGLAYWEEPVATGEYWRPNA